MSVSDPRPTVGVVGAGAMGRGLVQLFGQAGHRVKCVDAASGAAARAVEAGLEMIGRGVEKGRLPQDALAVATRNVEACADLSELADCDVVIEAIVEDLAAKRALFQALEEVVGEHAVLASNTSSLMVSEIAAACRRPERVAGLHFFNPVPLMKVVEVVPGVRTDPEVTARLRALVEGAGHRAVTTADQPGFLVNHAGRGLYTEGLRIVEEGVATPAEVDTVLRAAGFRMGPFELMDLTGLDVSGVVMTSIYAQFLQEPRLRPSSLTPPRIAAGLLGRKTGEGWYAYPDGVRRDPPAGASPPPLPAGLRVWVAPDAPDGAGLAALAERAGAHTSPSPGEADLLVVQPFGGDATSAALAAGLDPQRCVAVDPLLGLDRPRTLMLTAVTLPDARDAAHALLAADAGGVTLINDSPGFIAQRVLAVIVNIAAEIAQRRVASVADLEDAVRLGLGYPRGPLGWGDVLGPARVLAILQGLQAATGDPRYRPSPWLVRRAALGVSLLTPEAAR